MAGMTFQKAEKRQARLRLALDGPAGAGKTYTALITAAAIAGPDGRVAVIDTERGSASLYADRFDFDVLELHGSYDPARYVAAIRLAERGGYQVIVVDSLSHAWEAEGGVQEIADRNKKGGNSWSGWAAATPAYRALVDAILQSSCHVICTMRTKTEWVIGDDKKPMKVGTAPVMRAGIDFEFTVVGDLDVEHVMRISKSRCPAVADKAYRHPDETFGLELLRWLDDGGAPVEPVWRTRLVEAVARFGQGPVDGLLRSRRDGSAISPEILDDDARWASFVAALEAPAVSQQDAAEVGTAAAAGAQADGAGEGAPPADAPIQAELPVDIPVITEDQRRRFFAIAHERGVDDARQKEIVQQVAGVTSRADIPQARYDAVIAALEAEEAAA